MKLGTIAASLLAWGVICTPAFGASVTDSESKRLTDKLTSFTDMLNTLNHGSVDCGRLLAVANIRSALEASEKQTHKESDPRWVEAMAAASKAIKEDSALPNRCPQ